METKLAIVILNFNGKKHLENFLPSVCTNSTNHQIIIADNGSTDDSIHYLSTHFPKVQLIELKHNFGFAGGYNVALEQIKGQFDYYLLLNSDVEVTENWIEPLHNFLEENPSVAACQPKIKSWNNKNQFEHAGAAGGFIDRNYFPFCR
jgi:GT2 family glycosyltransferase